MTLDLGLIMPGFEGGTCWFYATKRLANATGLTSGLPVIQLCFTNELEINNIANILNI